MKKILIINYKRLLIRWYMFLPILFHFFWETFYYKDQMIEYGIFSFIYDFLICNLMILTIIAVFTMFVFYKLPTKRDIPIIFVCAIIGLWYISWPLVINVIQDNNVVWLITSCMLIINLSLFNLLNPYFWITILLNVLLISIILFLYFKPLKNNSQSNEINIKLKVSSFFTLEVENLNLNENDVIGVIGENGSGKSWFRND